METTTIEIPLALRNRLARAKRHPRQAYHEVMSRAMDALEQRGTPPAGALDPLVAMHQKAIVEAAKAHKASHVWLFGSRARGEARLDSDVDLLVEFLPGADLFDHAGLQARLEELLGMRVDTVALGGLRGATRRRILAERVPL
jgi:uncharacterized protein